MAKVDQKWRARILGEIKAETFCEAVVKHNVNAKYLIALLADLDYRPFKVINLGAGVKRIVLAEHICPTCKGKGFVKKE